ncbi:MAG: hypothetical protein ACRD29_16520 [Acidimicrobiales bacterium]
MPVFVPAPMAPEILRQVAASLESGGGVADAGRSDWSDATDQDRAVFFRDVPSVEWRLVAELARHDRPVPVADLADALGAQVGDVAGAIGPINKRAKREGWVAPVQPTRFIPEGSRSSKRGLLLHEDLRSWVLARDVDRGAERREA